MNAVADKGNIEDNHVPEPMSEVTSIPNEEEDDDIMKLLDMDGLPNEITENVPDSMTDGNSIEGQDVDQDDDTQSYEGNNFQKGNSNDSSPNAGEAEAQPGGDGDHDEGQQDENSPGSEVKKEKSTDCVADVTQSEQVDSSTNQKLEVKTDDGIKVPKKEPIDPSEQGDGNRKVIKVLMKSEGIDPLEALQLHLQKTQEEMQQQPQQQPQSAAQTPHTQPQAAPANQTVPPITIKQEPGVPPQNTNQQQQQQDLLKQQQQQQQIRMQQMQQQQQHQRMQQSQQQQSQFKQGGPNIRPPPPLQDMRSQVQMVTPGATSGHDGPVQCEICHRTFLTERGYLSHRHVHAEATGPPRPKLITAASHISCKTCLARAKFRMACMSGKANPGKVDFSAPCVECGSKTIPNLPINEASAMRQMYSPRGGRQPGPFIVPGTVRTLQQQQQMQQRASLQQRMAHQAQRFAGMYRQRTPYAQNHVSPSKAPIQLDDEDIKIVSVTPGRHSHKSPAKQMRQHQQGLRSPSQSPAKRRHIEGENGLTSPSNTPTKLSRNSDSSSMSSKSSEQSSSGVSTPEVTSSASAPGQQDDQNTDGLLDILVQQKKIYECTHCKILFREFSLYAVHIGMHSSENPMTCSMCGKACTSKFEFLCHHNNN